jgi:pyruvate,water dikinase
VTRHATAERAAQVFVPGAGEIPPASEIGGKALNLARLAAAGREPGSGFEVPRFVALPAAMFSSLALRGRPWPASKEEALSRAAEIESLELPHPLRLAVLARMNAAGLDRGSLAVRSSAAAEDSAGASFAGQFDSVLGVRCAESPEELWRAIRKVWASAFSAHAAAYAARGAGAGGEAPPVRMAVVVQEMVDPSSSGVAFSADPVSGALDVAVVCAVWGIGEGLVAGELDADTWRVAPGGALESAIARKDRAVRLAPGGRTRIEPVEERAQSAPALDDGEVLRVAECVRRLAARFGAPQDIEWAMVGEPGSERRLVVLQARPITTLGEPRGAVAGEPGTRAEPVAGAESGARAEPDAGAAEGGAAAPAASEPAGARADVTPRTHAAHERGAPAEKRGERRVWDNSNIAESYGGVTTPLTFGFARAVYEDVYRQFCRVMGVPESVIAANREVFAHMLGLVRGRVYYNLINWYRVLALLPGFAWNRAFMERMMGVRESLLGPVAPPGAGHRVRDFGRLLWMLARMVFEAARLGAAVPRFHARVEAALAPLRDADLAAWSEDDIVALYRRLEDELLHHWRAPLVNDFFAMIFFGVLGRLIETWLPGAPPTLANDLLCGEGDIISTEPARRVMALARRVKGSPALSRHFAAEPDDRALAARLAADPECADFQRELDGYVARFGDRCLEELKLETVTLAEDPAFLIQMVRAYAAGGTVDPEAARAHEVDIRSAAERAVRSRLRGLRRATFLWVLGNARRRVRDRENLRFERTRVFGLVRRMALALGARLARRGRLERTRDVFYLTLDELFADAGGTAVARDLRAVVALRRAEFEAYAKGPAPPDRFETTGPPSDWTPAAARGAGAGPTERELKGTGCCPGVVRAAVRIVRDPRDARDLVGRILVAERTDPGWTLLFPAARGLLVQRGSLLSHSAIVAREMGLPCVVGIAGLLDTLRDGEEVEMDGATGVVRRLGAETT